MPNDNRISALVISFNEEKNIEKCLQSIFWVDEIIIIDSCSTDNTRKLAEEFTNKIYSSKFEDDFSKLRNKGLEKARFNWVLTIDADEYLPDKVENIIRKLVTREYIEGYLFPRRNYINEKQYLKYGYFYPDFQLRLFRNNKHVRYTGYIHEQPSLDKSKLKKIKELEIYHNPTHTKYDSIMSFYRFFPYIRIEANHVARKVPFSMLLVYVGIKDFIFHFYRSYIKLEGYKDGYLGFRAAFIHSLYLGIISFYALYLKLMKNL